MMEQLKAVVELARPRNTVISFFGVLTGALLVSTSVDAAIILAAASAMLVLAGGNAINDYYDLDADRINRPKRPIPSGRITRKGALVVSTALFLAGIILGWFININCLLLAAANTIILVVYARHSKKALLTSNLMVSYLTASVFIYGALAVQPTENYNPLGAGLLGVLTASSFMMTLSREIIKDIEDVEGDRRMKAETLPIVMGETKALGTAATAGAAAMAISIMPFIMTAEAFNKAAYALFIIIANLIFISAYFQKPEKSQKLLVAGMAISLLAFLAGRLA
ncbi:MAG: geranylgeranylglycerol-phosphate geranylgeranyltransferase [Candidatus Altiarchaeota archaeon]|nr:geranylgeranylglycerol-phosphate geranylgeranyltransferase [Candidatus Altiarchaeota archaeon]